MGQFQPIRVGVCEEDPESIEHALVDCPFAQEVWGLSSLAFVQSWPSFHNFSDFVHHGLGVLTPLDIELLFMVAWRIWIAQNEKLWENHQTPARDICTKAGSLVTDFLDQGQDAPNPSSCSLGHWQPPSFSDYKINVASLWRKSSNSEGFGAVIRNSLGLVVADMCESLPLLGRCNSTQCLGASKILMAC